MVEGTAVAEHAGMRHICQQQTQAGIHVRVLDASTMSASRRMLLPDVVVFDDEVSYGLTAGLRVDVSSAPYFIRTHLTVTPRPVNRSWSTRGAG